MNGTVTPIIHAFLSRNITSSLIVIITTQTTVIIVTIVIMTRSRTQSMHELYYYYSRANPSNTVSGVPTPQACEIQERSAYLLVASRNVHASVLFHSVLQNRNSKNLRHTERDKVRHNHVVFEGKKNEEQDMDMHEFSIPFRVIGGLRSVKNLRSKIDRFQRRTPD